MDQPKNASIIRLSDTHLVLSHPDEDVRGRKVLDADGNDIGEVDDLMIDDQEKKVRFLRVASGGFLGIGEKKVLIPVDVIQKITRDAVQIDRKKEHIAGSPPYDPEVTDQPDWDVYYAYYGAVPFWAPGYTYPMYPYF